MRRILALLISALLSGLPAAWVQAPTTANAAHTGGHRHAAPARPHQVTLTGSLVATPQTANLAESVTLLLQVGDRTVLVHLTGRTRLADRNAAPLAMGSLHDGAVLRVTGSYSGGKVNASRVQDLSLPPLAVTVKGQLVATPGSAGTLCLASAAVTGASLPQALVPAARPCAAGQWPVYLTGSTRVTNQAGGAIALADLKASDTLQVTATLDSGKLLASLVMDLSLPATITVKGQLAAAPSPATMPPTGTLCLANTVVTSGRLLQAAQVASPCAAGQLPIYLSNSSKIVNRSGGALSLADLKASDTLQVTAALSNGKLLATLLMDMSR